MTRKYEELRTEKYSELVWYGRDEKYINVKLSRINLKRHNVKLYIEVSLTCCEKKIMISSDRAISFEELYMYLGSVRRYEYLFDGTFYKMKSCIADGKDVTETLLEIETGYFRYSKYGARLLINISDKDYTRFFRNWLIAEQRLGIINQMMLYADNIPHLTADIRLAMVAETYEAFAKLLEKLGEIRIAKEPTVYKEIICQNCSYKNQIPIKGRKTLKGCLTAVIDKYGKIVFSTEFRRRRRLIKKIVKTRNKVFHVNRRQSDVLASNSLGFYVIKLNLLYRYIILNMIGVKKETLDRSFSGIVSKYERKFPNCIFNTKTERIT